MLDTLQNNHLIQSLAASASQLRKCIDPLPDEMLTWQPSKSDWSVQMVLTHLLNCEPHLRERLARIVNEDHPLVPGFGPELAVPYSSMTVKRLLDKYEESRRQTLSQIYTYSSADWERTAVHSVIGETTLKDMIQLIVSHDTEHLGQLYDLRELWQSQHNNHEELT